MNPYTPTLRWVLPSLLAALMAPAAQAQVARFTVLKASLGDLREGKPAARKALEPGSQPDQTAMTMLSSGVDWKVQMVAAEWLLRAHNLRRTIGQALPDGADLQKAWTLAWAAWLNSDNTSVSQSTVAPSRQGASTVTDARGSQSWTKASSEYRQALKWLLAESAFRLGDPVKMAQAMDPLELKERFLPQEGLWVMMCAFHAGRWEMASQLHQELAGLGSVSSWLRNQALKNPTTFDYTVLGRATFQGQKNLPLEDMVRRSFTVKVRGEATGGAQPALLRLGVAGHWLRNLEGTQVPLSGAMDATQLQLVGYGAPGTALADTTFRLTLKPDPSEPNLWRGTETRESPSGRQEREIAWELHPER